MVEGRPITKADEGKKVALIEQSLASYNHLHLNDTIVVKNIVDSRIRASFKVIGIYKAPPATGVYAESVFYNPSDQIYMTLNSHPLLSNNVNLIINPDVANFAYYYLDNPTSANSFISAAKKLVGTENFEIKDESDLYLRITAPIRGAHTLTMLMVNILLAAGCVILVLIVALSLRGRRREFGILLAVGEKKHRIILQMFVETLIPVFIAFCLAAFASGFVSQKLSEKVLDKGNTYVQTQEAKTAIAGTQNVADMAAEAEENSVGFYNTEDSQMMNNLTVAVTPGDVGKFAGCGLLIVMVSVLVPVVSVIRLSPMAVLTKKE